MLCIGLLGCVPGLMCSYFYDSLVCSDFRCFALIDCVVLGFLFEFVSTLVYCVFCNFATCLCFSVEFCLCILLSVVLWLLCCGWFDSASLRLIGVLVGLLVFVVYRWFLFACVTLDSLICRCLLLL